MVCKSYDKYLVDYVFGETDPAQSAEIEEHLSSCRACADEVRGIRETVRILREADGRVNRPAPDPHFVSRVVHKIPQRRRESVVLMRRRSSSRAPLVAALSAAAILLAVIIYVLASQGSYVETGDSLERSARAPGGQKSPDTEHLAGLPAERPGQDSTQSQDTLLQPSDEANQSSGGIAEMVEEPEIEPFAPVPAPSPDLAADEPPEDVAPIPIPGEFPPGLVTEQEAKPLREWVACLYNLRGEVHLKRSGTDKWLRASESDRVLKGDSIRTASRGGGVAFLSAGGSVVFNRATMLNFNSHTDYELEKGEVLACSYRRPLVVSSNGVQVRVKSSGAYIQRRVRDTRVIATNGLVYVDCKGKTCSISPGKGAVIAADGRVEAIRKVNLEKEIEWVCEVTRKFKLWIEGECCRVSGYFAIQQNDRKLSNLAFVHKIGTTGSLAWRLKLPHAMPCYIWVRYSRSDREPEKIGLNLNGAKVDEKAIKAANTRWFWVKAFKVTLGRWNDMRLYFTSKRHVRSRVDLILVTNDAGYKPPRDIPKGGYYGKK